MESIFFVAPFSFNSFVYLLSHHHHDGLHPLSFDMLLMPLISLVWLTAIVLLRWIKVIRIRWGISPSSRSLPCSSFLIPLEATPRPCFYLFFLTFLYNQFYLSFITHAQPWHGHFIQVGSWRLPPLLLELSATAPWNYHQSAVPIPGAGTGAMAAR